MNLDANVNESLPFNEPAREILILTAHRWAAKAQASLRICAAFPVRLQSMTVDAGSSQIRHGSFECVFKE